MKYFSREELEKFKPHHDPVDLINYCLDRLIEDRKHVLSQDVVKGLTFEDLLETLVSVRPIIQGEIR